MKGWGEQIQTVIHRMGKYQDLYSKGNYIHYAVINYSGKEYEKECVCVCVCEPLCCRAKINSTL